MMLHLQLYVVAALMGIVSAYCTYTSWYDSFELGGQSTCNEANCFIRGLNRNDYKYDDQIHLLEGVDCSSAPSHWPNGEVQVVYADWTLTLDNLNQWAYCPAGYFLHGLERSDTGRPWYAGYLYHIDNARCTKLASHPLSYGHCYDVTKNFKEFGLFSCKEGYYIAGLHKDNCEYLHCIDRLKCCKMADKPEVLDELHKVKTRIMDTTLMNLANLANMLGYGYCAGTKGLNIGEDFKREKDSWAADSKLFWPDTECKGYKCNERLAIDYAGWTLAVKEIKYGQKVSDELQSEVVHAGVENNLMYKSMNKTFEVSKIVTETIQHLTTSCWKNNQETPFSLGFQFEDEGQHLMFFNTAFENSSSTSKGNSPIKSTTLKTITSQTIQPRSSAKYKIVLEKRRTTIPYTAVIIAKFNVTFRGFLKWGGGFISPKTNYHYQHKGSGSRLSVPYTFGDQSEAFYTALKRQSESQDMPWLWNEIIRNYPSAHYIINRLTDESQYKFTLKGKLEHVVGSNIDVIWENARLIRRSVPDRNENDSNHVYNKPFFAKAGPDDKPVDVKYPDVDLNNEVPFKLEITPLDPDSS